MKNDLALTFKNLPPKTFSDIIEVLQEAYAVGGASVAVLLFNLKGEVVGEITVSDTETNLSATVTALDAEGHETTFDDVPTWESSDEGVAVVHPSEDGYSATFDIGGPGSAVITVTGVENSSGENVDIVSVGTITVTPGDATVGSVEFSTGAPAEGTQ